MGTQGSCLALACCHIRPPESSIQLQYEFNCIFRSHSTDAPHRMTVFSNLGLSVRLKNKKHLFLFVL